MGSWQMSAPLHCYLDKWIMDILEPRQDSVETKVFLVFGFILEWQSVDKERVAWLFRKKDPRDRARTQVETVTSPLSSSKIQILQCLRSGFLGKPHLGCVPQELKEKLKELFHTRASLQSVTHAHLCICEPQLNTRALMSWASQWQVVEKCLNWNK